MDLTEDMDPLEDMGDVEYFKNHLFDKQVTRSTGKKEGKKFKINEPDKTAWGTRGVRQYYRVDQSQIGDMEKIL